MYDIIIKALEEIGICADIDIAGLSDVDKDVDLQEYVNDSMTFIAFILQLEDHLGMELPDDILLYESISSMKAFAESLENSLANES